MHTSHRLRRNQRTHTLFRLPARTSLRIVYALPFDSRQNARVFNQPLSSFDTSKVTNMGAMFYVRSLAPTSPESGALPESAPPPVHATCAAATPFHTPSRLPTRTSLRIVYALPPFDSPVGVGVQPAAELRYVHGHVHVQDV